MTAPFLQGSGVVPEPTALRLRGIQTDAYGEIKGGHKALFDPMQLGMTGFVMNGGYVDNLVTDGERFGPATGNLNYGQNIQTAKGIEFAESTGGNEYLRMPEAFDIFLLGNTPSFVNSFWLTNKLETGTGSPAIAGCAYQTGTTSQWSLSHDNAANILASRVQDAKHAFSVTLGEPVLVTQLVEKMSPTAFQFKTYKNAAMVGSTSKSYPFPDISGVTSASRNMGQIGGFSSAWAGIIHRAQILKIDPDFFDIDAWLANEIALNAPRWA